MLLYTSPYPQSVDGGMITKPKGLTSTSSNVTKSTSALPSTKSTTNKNDEVIYRDNKIKKAGPSTSNIHDPKKRLMVEEAKGKVWKQMNNIHVC